MTRPEFIQLFPTLRCNKRCGFCFSRDIIPVRDMSVSGFESLTGFLTRNGIGEVDILGGEPTLHPQLERFIESSAENGIRAFMSSNGSDPSRLDRLSARFGTDTLTVGVSINSKVSPALHKFIVARRPLLKTVFRRSMRLSAHIEEYLDSGMSFYLLFMDILSKGNLSDSIPFPEYMDALHRYQTRHSTIGGVYCSGFIAEEEEIDQFRCPAGSRKISILPDGSVYPCYLLFRFPEFRLGNIFENYFDSIWNNPVLDFFRKFEGNNCPKRDCNYFQRCRGGCPAVSLSVLGRIDAPDPRCGITVQSTEFKMQRDKGGPQSGVHSPEEG